MSWRPVPRRSRVKALAAHVRRRRPSSVVAEHATIMEHVLVELVVPPVLKAQTAVVEHATQPLKHVLLLLEENALKVLVA